MNKEENLGYLPYILSGLSFIPGIGIFFGVVSIIWGLMSKKNGRKRIIILGSCGIGLSVVLFSTLFYFGTVQRGGIYDDLRARMDTTNLTSLVKSLEFYKTEHGEYPKTLEILSESEKGKTPIFIHDSSIMNTRGKTNNEKGMRTFYYELIEGGSQYYLLGVGLDGEPFTSDDTHPDIKESSSIGYKRKKI